MKNQVQIRRKLKQVLFREYQKKLRKNLNRSPETCIFNCSSRIKGEKRTSFPNICTNGERGGWICDKGHGGMELAKKCPFWAPEKTKEEIKRQLALDYQDTLKRVRKNETHPEYVYASALLWTLGGEIPEEGIQKIEEFQSDKTWKNWKIWPWNWWRK